jgi:predicted DNA-binding transcriptional regulator YafY
MAVNKNALLRYKILDSCFRNRYKKWTLEMLIDHVGDALFEYEGMDNGIGKRTIQADIQMMRSDKLGYNAPIIVIDKRYYTYEDPNYSITNIPLSESDLGKMNEAVNVLKQFKGFSHFKNLTEVVQKLEDHVYSNNNHEAPVIHFDRNERLKGIELLDIVHESIITKRPLEVCYQSFNARAASTFIFHAWWLKEFKNRWFMVGIRDKKNIIHLALDRILEISIHPKERYVANTETTAEEFYRDIIGVTVFPNSRPSKVVLFVSRTHAPYVETKPLHHSQEITKRLKDGIMVQLTVQLNYELEKEILGFGMGVTVLSPKRLQLSIRENLKNAVKYYDAKALGELLREAEE